MTVITALPPVRRIVVHDLPEQARREELQALAREVLAGTAQSAYGVRVHVAALAHPSLLFGAVLNAWSEYLAAVRDCDAVDLGEITEPGVPQDLLRDDFAGEREACLNVLLHGTARGRGVTGEI